MTAIHDTAELARDPPIPALWATTAFAGVVSLILIFQVVFAFTKLRMVCLIACISTLVLTVTNAADTYYPLQLDEIHSVMFAFITIIYFDLIIAIFLNIGSAFYYAGDRKTVVFWIVVSLAIGFSLVAGSTSLALFLTDASDTVVLILSVFVVVACLGGMIGAVAYAFIPLVANRKIPSSQSDAYAVGIWYLTIIMTIMVGYVVFYALAFANVANYNPLGQINQAIDFCFRVVLVLAYGLPPNRRVLRYIREKLIVLVGTSNHASNHARWSSGIEDSLQKGGEAGQDVVVISFPVEMSRMSKEAAGR